MVSHDYLISGNFDEIGPSGAKTSIRIFANDHELFYQRNSKTYCLAYYLTVLQEHFCFLRHQSSSLLNSEIYEIKLKNKGLITILSTPEIETFIEFYLLLGKHCILTTFQSHYKICESSHKLPRHRDPCGWAEEPTRLSTTART